MPRTTTRLLLTFSSIALALAGRAPAQPLTVPEASGFRQTSRLADVEAFFQELQRSSKNVLAQRIGVSVEGRPIWMYILGDPPPATPAEARSLGKPVVFVEANIHAGEVEGKEALQMLARDIVLGDLGHLLRNQALLLVPVLNPDGNEQISVHHRRNQAGPEGGVGVRYNGQGLDLNRDFVKLESPEIRAVVRVLNEWDPVLFVDIHTTNGSKHRHTVTYAVPHNPNGDAQIDAYLRQRLIPWVARQMESRYDDPIIPYGNFRRPGQPDSGWVTYSPLARYGTNYVGLRNRFSILVENYAYAPFEQRVKGCYRFVSCVLEYTNRHGQEMLALVHEADLRARRRTAGLPLGVEFRPATYPERIRIRSYEFVPDTATDGRVRWIATKNPREYEIPYYGLFEATRSVPIPAAYAFPPMYSEAAHVLSLHGVTVLKVEDTLRVKAERFHFTDVRVPRIPFQGHWLVQATFDRDTVEVTLPPGSFLVQTNQPLGVLAAWLLEPESPDGLLTWNFFDRAIPASEWGGRLGTCPVVKLQELTAVAAEIYRPDR